MQDIQAELKSLQPKHKYLVAIDSDGCAFDSMEIKHKECFIPNIIKYWDLQSVSKYARAAAEFVNLYSQWRGINRFPALIMTFNLLNDWPDVQKRNAVIPQAESLRKWVSMEIHLSNPSLHAKVKETNDTILKKALDWSEAVNKTVSDLVYNIPPFIFVRESLEKLSEWADIVVCSATPEEALKREWEEHDIAKYVRVIAGQEMGTKKDHLEILSNGKYDKNNILMVGDALGDMKAAHSNGLHFFPVNPGEEEDSWEDFLNHISDVFHGNVYNKEMETKYIDRFKQFLPDTPPWKK